MKISKKKHSELTVMLSKALNFYYIDKMPLEKIVPKIIDRIEQILNETKHRTPEEIKQFNKYFCFCNFCELFYIPFFCPL